MKIQTSSNELLIRIPNGLVDVALIQDFLNYLRFKAIVSKSQATDEDIEALSNEINQAWLDKQHNISNNEDSIG